MDITRETGGGHIFLVNDDEERYINVKGKVGTPYYGELIRDCLERTEIAMTQEHALKAAELCLIAQNNAKKVDEYLFR
ncbi:oxidoreductase domain protein [Gracilibacillus boraciitolerans JCM 21714]|uniref:Oxidoreductase domain protein n=1 Tax=Gracilibacillus boraciitolerans JCM 21714 TaxID=1298598 RepID=W4VNQ7_9BACI|nr:oxidoreductase domain protein [Gracilibacillus boraciitolerans JCM 21714]